ncbi:MAG TPA: hypothetical protein VFW65_34745 [Pseudonocardiaceae bacterium]|nr:hypothetical protein [Pseudonocardiaceae bacterium]
MKDARETDEVATLLATLLDEAVTALADPDMSGYERCRLAERLRGELQEPAAEVLVRRDLESLRRIVLDEVAKAGGR